MRNSKYREDRRLSAVKHNEKNKTILRKHRGMLDVPIDFITVDLSSKDFEEIELVYKDDMYISEVEYSTKVVYPSVNELNTDIIEKVNTVLSSI